MGFYKDYEYLKTSKALKELYEEKAIKESCGNCGKSDTVITTLVCSRCSNHVTVKPDGWCSDWEAKEEFIGKNGKPTMGSLKECCSNCSNQDDCALPLKEAFLKDPFKWTFVKCDLFHMKKKDEHFQSITVEHALRMQLSHNSVLEAKIKEQEAKIEKLEGLNTIYKDRIHDFAEAYRLVLEKSDA